MTKLSDNILQTIEKKHLEPKPRWQFLVRNIIFWGVFVVSVVLGSLSFSVIMSVLVRHDWDLYRYLEQSFLGFLLLSLPYIWIAFLAAFGILAYYYCRHTKHGYRFAPYIVLLASVGTSIVLGEVLFLSGLGHKTDLFVMHVIPQYQQARHAERVGFWFRPDRGLLIGEVVGVSEQPGFLFVRDNKGNVWNVAVNDLVLPTLPPAEERPILKIIGNRVGEQEFSATVIRPCDCEDEEFDR